MVSRLRESSILRTLGCVLNSKYAVVAQYNFCSRIQVMDKCAEADPQPACMTLHPGFEAVCLNPWVLQTEHASMLQYYGEFDQDQFTEEE